MERGVTALRILNVIVWGSMLVYMAPAAWSAAFGKATRRGDPMRLACLAMAFVMIGFNLRWLLIPDDTAVWMALCALSAAAGVYILMLARSYGRGSVMKDRPHD
jgi:hypothetical protein